MGKFCNSALVPAEMIYMHGVLENSPWIFPYFPSEKNFHSSRVFQLATFDFPIEKSYGGFVKGLG